MHLCVSNVRDLTQRPHLDIPKRLARKLLNA